MTTIDIITVCISAPIAIFGFYLLFGVFKIQNYANKNNIIDKYTPNKNEKDKFWKDDWKDITTTNL